MRHKFCLISLILFFLNKLCYSIAAGQMERVKNSSLEHMLDDPKIRQKLVQRLFLNPNEPTSEALERMNQLLRRRVYNTFVQRGNKEMADKLLLRYRRNHISRRNRNNRNYTRIDDTAMHISSEKTASEKNEEVEELHMQKRPRIHTDPINPVNPISEDKKIDLINSNEGNKNPVPTKEGDAVFDEAATNKMMNNNRSQFSSLNNNFTHQPIVKLNQNVFPNPVKMPENSSQSESIDSKENEETTNKPQFMDIKRLRKRLQIGSLRRFKKFQPQVYNSAIAIKDNSSKDTITINHGVKETTTNFLVEKLGTKPSLTRTSTSQEEFISEESLNTPKSNSLETVSTTKTGSQTNGRKSTSLQMTTIITDVSTETTTVKDAETSRVSKIWGNIPVSSKTQGTTTIEGGDTTESSKVKAYTEAEDESNEVTTASSTSETQSTHSSTTKTKGTNEIEFDTRESTTESTIKSTEDETTTDSTHDTQTTHSTTSTTNEDEKETTTTTDSTHETQTTTTTDSTHETQTTTTTDSTHETQTTTTTDSTHETQTTPTTESTHETKTTESEEGKGTSDEQTGYTTFNTLSTATVNIVRSNMRKLGMPDFMLQRIYSSNVNKAINSGNSSSSGNNITSRLSNSFDQGANVQKSLHPDKSSNRTSSKAEKNKGIIKSSPPGHNNNKTLTMLPQQEKNNINDSPVSLALKKIFNSFHVSKADVSNLSQLLVPWTPSTTKNKNI
ncbi:uncharacterized protein [Lepeophtheirus salmonis]|uniref:uncharacterized protein isoform X3 n=1 Tax=Lepeophtheirus salmonis TaxID=72036 RepID=UPI003AF3E10A